MKIDFVSNNSVNTANITNLKFRKLIFYPALLNVFLASLINNYGLIEILKSGEFILRDKAALLLILAISLLHLLRES